MAGSYLERVAEARKIEGQICSGGAKIATPQLWTDFARLCWPHKTAFHLAAISGRDERTAKRWLSGEFEPPLSVVSALIQKLFEPRA